MSESSAEPVTISFSSMQAKFQALELRLHKRRTISTSDEILEDGAPCQLEPALTDDISDDALLNLTAALKAAAMDCITSLSEEVTTLRKQLEHERRASSEATDLLNT